jgi:hypothetical protein
VSARPTVHLPHLPQGDQHSEVELLLSAVTELSRFQREVLQCVQRLEVSLDELHDRLEARARPPGAHDESPPAASAADIKPSTSYECARSDEDLLRAIQDTLHSVRIDPTR